MLANASFKQMSTVYIQRRMNYNIKTKNHVLIVSKLNHMTVLSDMSYCKVLKLKINYRLKYNVFLCDSLENK